MKLLIYNPAILKLLLGDIIVIVLSAISFEIEAVTICLFGSKTISAKISSDIINTLY